VNTGQLPSESVSCVLQKADTELRKAKRGFEQYEAKQIEQPGFLDAWRTEVQDLNAQIDKLMSR
jgi:hypothetical protein